MLFRIVFIALLFVHSVPLLARPFLPSSFCADYEQTIVKKISGKTKTVQGRVEYLYPGHIRFEQGGPEKIVWVSNPKTTWFYQPPFIKEEPGNLREYPTPSASPSKIFDLLQAGLSDNKKRENTVELILKDKKAILTFNGTQEFKNLHSIKILEKDNVSLELVFKSINSNRTFKPEHFIFKPPPNTRIERP